MIQTISACVRSVSHFRLYRSYMDDFVVGVPIFGHLIVQEVWSLTFAVFSSTFWSVLLSVVRNYVVSHTRFPWQHIHSLMQVVQGTGMIVTISLMQHTFNILFGAGVPTWSYGVYKMAK